MNGVGVAFSPAAEIYVFEQESGGGGITISNNNAREEMAQQFTTGHVLVNQYISQCTWFLSKSLGSPSGNMFAYIRESDGTTKEQSSNSVDASGISGIAEYTFTFSGDTKLLVDEMLTICLDNGTGGAGNTIACTSGGGAMTNGQLYKNSACGSGFTAINDEQMKMSATYSAAPI